MRKKKNILEKWWLPAVGLCYLSPLRAHSGLQTASYSYINMQSSILVTLVPALRLVKFVWYFTKNTLISFPPHWLYWLILQFTFSFDPLWQSSQVDCLSPSIMNEFWKFSIPILAIYLAFWKISQTSTVLCYEHLNKWTNVRPEYYSQEPRHNTVEV